MLSKANQEILSFPVHERARRETSQPSVSKRLNAVKCLRFLALATIRITSAVKAVVAVEVA